MNALQHWYEYVDRVSRPADTGRAPRFLPRSELAALPAPEDPDRIIDLGPRLRARRFLATLCPPEVIGGLAELLVPDAEPAPASLDLEFEPYPVRLPTLGECLPELPCDRAPWDGDVRVWIRTVAERLMPDPPAAHPRGPVLADFAALGEMAPPSGVSSHADPGAGLAVDDAPVPTFFPAVDGGSSTASQVPNRVPRHWEVLLGLPPNDVAQNSYKKPFRESRDDMVRRLLDPPLTLEEAARVLGVCPTTVRRYTNRGALRHFRTPGNQRRFRLSDVLNFLETRAAEIDADAAAERRRGGVAGEGSSPGENLGE